jgi:photosystem II stability/assembly factor-like uncharacterized protein
MLDPQRQRSQPNAAWVAARIGHGSALFRTSDGGRTWNRTVLLRR